MCGINGLIQFRPVFEKKKMEAIVHQMNDGIIHRGPDAEGFFADECCAMGMRRLSVIDVQGGAQPIWNESRDRLIIFNGELYNYRELKKQLQREGHIFATSSDTEVVLHGMESHGTAFLERMEGMFAFAFYDRPKREWILARDRTGEKPLYYFCGDGFLHRAGIPFSEKQGRAVKSTVCGFENCPGGGYAGKSGSWQHAGLTGNAGADAGQQGSGDGV